MDPKPAIETSDPDTLTTATVAIVGTILVIVVVVFVQGLYESMHRAEFQRKVVAEAPAELRSLRAAQRARLGETGWVDKKNGIVAVRIERAMELLASDPDPAAPIIVAEPPAAEAPAAPAPATAAAPAAPGAPKGPR
jgi:hypothetical protein